MATLQNIDNPTWGMGLHGYGVIVEGIASIRQCIDLIIRTSKGSDPLRAEFGSDVYKFIDAPLNLAIPNIKKEILEALEMWETRITVISINHFLREVSNPVFEIVYQVKDDNLIDKLLFDMQDYYAFTEELNELILQAFFPPNPKNFRYQVKLIKNNTLVFPNPPLSGFASTIDLFNWIQANWAYVGRWHLLTDKVVCYMNAAGVVSASLEISILSIFRMEAIFPDLLPGENYNVGLLVAGAAASPAMPQTFTNPGEVLAWANGNWSDYANWIIEYGNSVEGEFTDEYSPEFNVNTQAYKLVGISNVEGFTGTLSITTI